ncbi:MAG: ribosome biogenesis GTPase YlqF [Lachnospiraceae bacterium]|nr:ribosome biogenesis GTPase YlqF [Lachnospiraceae bacterium]
MNIQWYPGHMTKAKRAMEESLRLIDVIIELVDARAPLSSRNPDIDRLGRQKYRILLLNKADLADESANLLWEKWFTAQGCHVVKLDARSGSGMRAVQETIQEACREKIERDRRRGIQNRPVRAMVAGIPNVGKSTFINSFARKSCTKTGNKPGVTKGNQWIRLNRNVELLDTPGILWPKFEDAQVATRLALIGSINDNVLNREELAAEGLRFMQDHYPEALAGRYEGAEMGGEPWEALASLAVLRQCLKRGGEPDTEKAAALFLEDLRSGRLGRITLETPPEET